MRRTGKNTGTETRESVFAGKHQWWGKEPMPEVFLHVCCFDILFWLWRTSIPSYTRGILVVRPFWSIAPVADPRSPPHPLGKCILSWKERGEKSEEEERERERRWGGGGSGRRGQSPQESWLCPPLIATNLCSGRLFTNWVVSSTAALGMLYNWKVSGDATVDSQYFSTLCSSEGIMLLSGSTMCINVVLCMILSISKFVYLGNQMCY